MFAVTGRVSMAMQGKIRKIILQSVIAKIVEIEKRRLVAAAMAAMET